VSRDGVALALLVCAILNPLPGQAPDDPAEQADTGASASLAPPADEGFHWKPALLESGFFLALQHTSRLAQAKTRREFGGPFWSDYFESASNIHTWNDSDSILTDYFGHPWMGAMTGYIQVFNDPKGRDLEFDLSSKEYWKSRLKAMAWTAAYSTQYELGPVSEASLGNVGKKSPTMAVVDLVMTPVGGLTWMLIEDYVDKRFISRWEQGASGKKARFFRVALNPGRSVANLLRFKRPSYRDNRPL